MQLLRAPGAKTTRLYEFLRCLTTCHTVIREKDGTYRAESPDELALLQGVGAFQCALKDRGTAGMNIEMMGETTSWQVCHRQSPSIPSLSSPSSDEIIPSEITHPINQPTHPLNTPIRYWL